MPRLTESRLFPSTERIKDKETKRHLTALIDTLDTSLRDAAADLREIMPESSLAASRLVKTNANKKLASTDLIDWITGTTNQITVTDDGDGTVTLSAPQDLHTGASPTFSGLTATDITATNSITVTNTITEFSTDGTLADNSDSAVPTEKAVKTYADNLSLGDNFVDRGDPSGADFTEADLTTDGNWHDLDLSAIVPSGAKAVLISLCVLDDAAGNFVQLRKNGNINETNVSQIYTQAADVWSIGDCITPCDSNRIIEYKATNTTFTEIQIRIRGWWI